MQISSLRESLFVLCLFAGAVSELITIAAPGKVLGIVDSDPEELAASPLFRIILSLSALYLIAVVMMFTSGNSLFQTYGMIILGISLGIWMFRKPLLQHRYLQLAATTVCLVLLLDTVRKVLFT